VTITKGTDSVFLSKKFDVEARRELKKELHSWVVRRRLEEEATLEEYLKGKKYRSSEGGAGTATESNHLVKIANSGACRSGPSVT
jgi:hypothetical protein